MGAPQVRSLRAVGLVLALIGLGCGDDPFPSRNELDKIRAMTPLSRTISDSSNAVLHNAQARVLGRSLFEDSGLSGCGNVSCATCHREDSGYTVNEPRGLGCGGQPSARNPPTLLNVGHGRWYMWDGRADRLWSQAILPVLNPAEMAGTKALVRSRLEGPHASDYQAVFGKSPAAEDDDRLLANMGKAIAAYEAQLVRVRAPFDADVQRFIAAAEAGNAEDDPLHLGLMTFMRKGKCFSCHQGPAFTDDRFHNVGLEDLSDLRTGHLSGAPALLDSPFRADGIYSDDPRAFATRLANLEADVRERPAELEGAFRTPTLRNVELTAPYMHTGELSSLEDVIDFYARGGDEEGTFVGTRADTISRIDLSGEERAALLALLRSLTGAPP